MTPVKGGYAVDVPVINVSERARREHASIWSTFRAFAVTLRHLFTSLFKGDTPTINYPEQTRPYSERFRGTHILTVRGDGSLKCVACYMCATICPAECIYIEAGEHPNPEIEKFPAALRHRYDALHLLRFLRRRLSGRSHHHEPRTPSVRLQPLRNDLHHRETDGSARVSTPKDRATGPTRPMVEAKIFNKEEQKECAFPSVVEERHPAVLYESMIRKRGQN